MGRKRIYVPLIILLVLILAGASLFTTFGIWDGRLPSAKFRIFVRGNKGKAISNAKLQVYENTGCFKGRGKMSYGFPLSQFKEDSQFQSSSDGVIEVSHIAKNIEIGGAAFALFWVIPITTGHPHFSVTVSAPGYKSAEIDYNKLYSNCDKTPTFLVDDNVPVCTFEFTLVPERE
jgi:hypothetical protein